MNIFTRIKNAIFGDKADAPGGGSSSPPARPTGAGPATNTNAGNSTSIPASPSNAKWDAPVDVEAVLSGIAAKNPQKLNWKTSIVDLMKLLDIDSSQTNRKELAQELGYSGDLNDSATMNIWLHKRVMQELEKNGGKVSPALLA